MRKVLNHPSIPFHVIFYFFYFLFFFMLVSRIQTVRGDSKSRTKLRMTNGFTCAQRIKPVSLLLHISIGTGFHASDSTLRVDDTSNAETDTPGTVSREIAIVLPGVPGPSPHVTCYR